MRGHITDSMELHRHLSKSDNNEKLSRDMFTCQLYRSK